MKQRLRLLLCALALFLVLQPTARADVGPKPSVTVTFQGLEQEVCYVTLLSKTPSTGPYSAYDGKSYQARYQPGDEDYEIWKAFLAYQDPDGFYFLQYFSRLASDGVFRWGYYPPGEFKILLYFPEGGCFAVSEVYSRFAFDSYYHVDATGLNPGENGTIQAVKYYNYAELWSLLARLGITLILELGLALLFGFRQKSQLLVIGVTNVVTQPLLNLLLNLANYRQRYLMFLFNYFWMELVVMAVEAVVYSFSLPRLAGQPAPSRRRIVGYALTAVGYALTANVLSFFGGLALSRWLPGIF